jgi:(R,R)-butanediol dehydrogenase/meso-butanediol dehydrogenase/diacetyl reductase
MAAAVFKGKASIDIEDVPVPDAAPGTVLVEVSHCGVCGSDLHMVMDGWGRPGSIGGHEWSGTVVAVGDGVDRWQAGDTVVGGPDPTCGVCEPCLAGRPSLCLRGETPGTHESRGAFTRYVVADERAVVRIPAGLGLRDAALAEPLAVALHGITLSGVAPGHRVIVHGAGPIGALVIAALRARGIDDIKVSEPSPVRRALAERLGATQVVTPDALDVPGPMDPARVVDDAVDVAFECSGHGSAMEAALAQLKRTGTLVLVGAGMAAPRFDPNRILLNELVITGSFCYDATGIEDALSLLATGALPVDVLVEPDDVGLRDLLATMERLVAGEVGGKVLVVPDPGGS